MTIEDKTPSISGTNEEPVKEKDSTHAVAETDAIRKNKETHPAFSGTPVSMDAADKITVIATRTSTAGANIETIVIFLSATDDRMKEFHPGCICLTFQKENATAEIK